MTASFEDPVTTVILLISKNIHVVKEDSSIAAIYVSREWMNKELFKNYDAQITVGLPSNPQKRVNLSGSIKLSRPTLAVTVWALDRTGDSDTGRQMRQKVVDEVKRIIEANMKTANVSIYDFADIENPSSTNKAFSAVATTELAPNNSAWTELLSADYQKIWSFNAVVYTKTISVNLQNALMLFGFKITNKVSTIKSALLTFVGSGSGAGAEYSSPLTGCTIKVWNSTTNVWEHSIIGTTAALTISLTANLQNYVDADGYVWLLAEATDPSNGTYPASLSCDYVSCQVTVNRITYIEITNFGDKDKVDIKPFIFKTIFTLKAWALSTITILN